VEIKVEADSNDVMQCLHSDMPGTSIFVIRSTDTLFSVFIVCVTFMFHDITGLKKYQY